MSTISDCVDQLTDEISKNGKDVKQTKIIMSIYLVLELLQFLWLCYYVHLQYVRQVRSTLFTRTMSALLFTTSMISIFDASIMLRVLNPHDIPSYLAGNTNLAQRMCINNCSMSYYLLTTTSIVTLWSAACLLGLKYKMTAHKIHMAVSKHALVDRKDYQEIFNWFTGVFALCLVYYVYAVIIICGISLLGWPEFLYKIESAMAFVLIMIIFLAYYLSFKEMREALAQHTKEASMRI